MPRASFDPDKAKQGSSGVENGNYLVSAAKIANVEGFGKKVQPAIVVTATLCDKDGDPVRDADPVDIQWTFGPESSRLFSPGKGKAIDDTDPEDLGKDLDIEGNTLYCDEGAQLNASSAGTVLFKSLKKHGFPQEVLDAAWAPAFVGLKFRLETLPAKDVNAMCGTRLNEKPNAQGQVFPYKVVTKWLNPDYLGKNGASHAVATETKSTEPVKAAGTKMTIEEVLTVCVTKLAAKKSGKGPIASKGSLLGFIKNEFSTGPGKSSGIPLGDFNKFISDDENMKNALMTAGAELGLDDATGDWTGAVTFG